MKNSDVGNCTSETVESVGGEYQISIPLDRCGTSVAQNNGSLIFENKIRGDISAAGDQKIIIFNVSCSFLDKVILHSPNRNIEDRHSENKVRIP